MILLTTDLPLAFLLVLPLAFLFVWGLIEIVTCIAQRLNNYIKNEGRYLLEQELADCWLNSLDDDIICLKNKSKLTGSYIAKTGTSIIFPYYFSSTNGLDYGILIFSKEYYIVRDKFIELKKTPKNKRLKF